jgi:hypothetical protein
MGHHRPIAPPVFRAVVDRPVEVIVSQIPELVRVDQLAAAGTPNVTAGYSDHPSLTQLLVAVAVASPA